jgi:hypothetical protein
MFETRPRYEPLETKSKAIFQLKISLVPTRYLRVSMQEETLKCQDGLGIMLQERLSPDVSG